MFKRLYSQKLVNGDRTSLAYQVGKSEEWISRLTRYAGEPCPAEKYFRRYCALHQVNPQAANALHESLCAHIIEARAEQQDGHWQPQAMAVTLVKQAAQTVAALIETDCAADDLPALLDLKVMVETAIERCGTRSTAMS